MRTSHKIALLTGILCLLALIARWDEQQSTKEAASKANAKSSFSFAPEDVTKIRISEEGKKPIHLHKDPASGWQLRAPLSYKGDERNILAMLYALNQYSFQKIVSADKKQWPAYGLGEQAKKELTIYLKNAHKPLTLYIGDKSPVGYGVYYALEGDPRVFLGSQYLVLATSRSTHEFRDKSLVTIDEGALTSLSYQRAEGPLIHISKDADGDFTMKSPLSAKVDKVELYDFLKELGQIRVEAFFDAPLDGTILQAFAKQQAAFELQWTEDKDKTHSLKFIYWQGELLASFGDKELIFQIPLNSSTILTKEPASFRDRHIFAFAPGEIKAITIDDLHLSKENSEWIAKEKSQQVSSLSPAQISGQVHDFILAKTKLFPPAPDTILPKDRLSQPDHFIKIAFRDDTREKLTVALWEHPQDRLAFILQHSDSKQTFILPKASFKFYN